ncbi:hypothetical protein Sjap_005211 [Stephania japonica]|uniref:Pentatricopeptide repeat-containing protein n=1 Tax=Stephania japonica TaxID=461633 RepID=A0AAP0K558_9MAGN
MFTYNILISCFSTAGRVEDVVRLFEEMADGDCKPDVLTYNSLINCLGKNGDRDEAHMWSMETKEKVLNPDVITYTTLIECFWKTTDGDLRPLGFRSSNLCSYRIQRACTVLGDHGGEGMSLWEALPTVDVLGGQLVLQLYKTDEEQQEYAVFLHAPKRRFADFGVRVCVFGLRLGIVCHQPPPRSGERILLYIKPRTLAPCILHQSCVVSVAKQLFDPVVVYLKMEFEKVVGVLVMSMLCMAAVGVKAAPADQVLGALTGNGIGNGLGGVGSVGNGLPVVNGVLGGANGVGSGNPLGSAGSVAGQGANGVPIGNTNPVGGALGGTGLPVHLRKLL